MNFTKMYPIFNSSECQVVEGKSWSCNSQLFYTKVFQLQSNMKMKKKNIIYDLCNKYFFRMYIYSYTKARYACRSVPLLWNIQQTLRAEAASETIPSRPAANLTSVLQQEHVFWFISYVQPVACSMFLHLSKHSTTREYTPLREIDVPTQYPYCASISIKYKMPNVNSRCHVHINLQMHLYSWVQNYLPAPQLLHIIAQQSFKQGQLLLNGNAIAHVASNLEIPFCNAPFRSW